MNVSGGDDLYVLGFNRDLRFDRDDNNTACLSINSSNHSLVVHKSDSSGSPPEGGKTGQYQQHYYSPPSQEYGVVGQGTAYRPATEGGAIETDFYRNPTILSRMILFGKYSSANKRCRDHPEEASVWVCAKRKSNVSQVSPFYGIFEKRSNVTRRLSLPRRQQQQQQQQPQNRQPTSSDSSSDDYSLRQLPIHIACTSLAFAHDSHLRSELEQLIVRLVVTFPEGCADFDHGGKLPLHEAIWSNATPETIAMLLMASPSSIDQRDKFGRTPRELNARRQGKNKTEIGDMLDLGVPYWDQARQEARLRMKLAVIPPSGQSIASTSVMGTSQADKETIVTDDGDNCDATPLPKDVHNNPRRQRIEFKPEEVTPMAWEQLERRVLLLEQLLSEMYEQNYELAGVVEELKKTKKALTLELEAARATQHRAGASVASSQGAAKSTAGGSQAWSSLGHAVSVVPEDDEMSSVKLMEHTERVEQLESLVGSYSHVRKRRVTGSSRVSELSSFSSNTQDGASVRNRLVRSDSLVSGLTASEASFFDASIYAVRQAWHDAQDDDDDDDTTVIDIDVDGNNRKVTGVLGTDNLTDMFHKGAVFYGGSGHQQKVGNEASPRSGACRAWAAPMPIASSAQTETPSPDMPSLRDITSQLALKEDLSSSSSSASAMEESKASAPPNTGEIYYPGFQMESDVTQVNSTISISGTSAVSAESMSENTTIMSDENEIYFLGHDSRPGDASTAETMSTRGRVEHIVFGGARRDENEAQDASSEAPTRDPSRYNFDIRIPALDTYYANETSE